LGQPKEKNHHPGKKTGRRNTEGVNQIPIISVGGSGAKHSSGQVEKWGKRKKGNELKWGGGIKDSATQTT